MKYKVIGGFVTIAMIVSVMIASSLESGNGTSRYHQHLSYDIPSDGCDCDGSELCTHLPIIRIDTGGQTIPGNVIVQDGDVEIYETAEDGSEEIYVTIETIEQEGKWHHASDEADIESNAMFRIRGNSSRNFDKKNYRIKLVKDETAVENEELPLLGMSVDNDWALHGPFLDKTLMRNYMWMNISAEIMGYAPNVRFCELIIDGEYQGVYVLMETIKEDDFRVNLSDYDERTDQTSYIILMDRVMEEISEMNNYTWYTHQLEFLDDVRTGFQVIYPNELALTEEKKEYIEDDISKIERGLYSADMPIGRYDYDEELDVDSFVDYYVLQEFLANNDAFFRSTYLYRDVRGTLHCGPVWDYNNVADNFFRAFSYHGFLLANRSWYGRLMTDDEFVEKVISRYKELREGVLSDEYIEKYIDDVIEFLGPAIERNDEVWGYSYDPTTTSKDAHRIPDGDVTLEEINPSSYEDAVSKMKTYLKARGEWMDENIETLRQYCHRSKTASQRVE